MQKKGIHLTGLFFFLLGTMLFSPSKGFSKDVDVSVQIDSNNVLIGDWINMKVEVHHDKDVHVFWPDLSKSLPANDDREIEVLSSSATDTTTLNDDFIKESRKLTLTAFDSGYYVILPLQFKYQLQGDDSFYSAESEPLLLTVRTLEVDTAQPIKPIKDPLNLPFRLSEIRNYLIGGAALLVLLAALLIYFKTRKKKPVMVKKITVRRPPHEIALEKLRAVEQEKIWQKGEVKRYYSELTDIIREYTELRFSFLAMESTTDEIIYKMRNVVIDKEQKENLQELLQHADLVKFAKANPLPDEHKRYYDMAVGFVQKTKRDTPVETIETMEEAS